MKTNLSVIKEKELKYGISGAGWIGFGVFRLFDNLICNGISVVFIFITVVSLLYCVFAKKEADDEMSKMHLYKAKARTLDKMEILVGFIGLILLNLNSVHIDMGMIYPFIIGFIEFVSCGYFIYYEKVGD